MTKKASQRIAVMMLRELGPLTTGQIYEELNRRWNRPPSMNELTNLLRFAPGIKRLWRHDDPGHPLRAHDPQPQTIWILRE
jgi:hypothetical protein